ncbi:Na+/H+ antiporter subunit E [Propionivibrio limicola]|uniref:Na+/H+ antiporter subunit E n=1 Tax=Propionivibrio limicola TaxID=167645 RepID=UPI001FE91828|nr:Na+/H+ antiporter subunit E [Propionivibrio limicola]
MLGGLQVARLALQPRAQPKPGLIELELNLPAGAPRVLMANALGPMPGTLGVRLDGHHLYVHLLDERLNGRREANVLEARIAHLFEARP